MKVEKVMNVTSVLFSTSNQSNHCSFVAIKLCIANAMINFRIHFPQTSFKWNVWTFAKWFPPFELWVTYSQHYIRTREIKQTIYIRSDRSKIIYYILCVNCKQVSVLCMRKRVVSRNRALVRGTLTFLYIRNSCLDYVWFIFFIFLSNKEKLHFWMHKQNKCVEFLSLCESEYSSRIYSISLI